MVKVTRQPLEVIEFANSDDVVLIRAGAFYLNRPAGEFFDGQDALIIPPNSLVPDKLIRFFGIGIDEMKHEATLLDIPRVVAYVLSHTHFTYEDYDAAYNTGDYAELLDIKDNYDPITGGVCQNISLGGTLNRSTYVYPLTNDEWAALTVGDRPQLPACCIKMSNLAHTVLTIATRGATRSDLEHLLENYNLVTAHDLHDMSFFPALQKLIQYAHETIIAFEVELAYTEYYG